MNAPYNPNGGGFGPGSPGGFGPGSPGGFGPGTPGGFGPGSPGGFGPAPGMPTPSPGPMPAPAPTGGVGKKLAIGAVGVLVLGVAVAAGAYFWLYGSSGPELAKYAPEDTLVYAEVPSLAKALVQFTDIDSIDAKALDTKGRKDEMIEAFASSFDLKKDEADDVLTGISSVAMAVGKVEDRERGALLVGFRSKGAIEPLLKSERFEEDGKLSGGKRFKIERFKGKMGDEPSPFEFVFGGLRASEKEPCVWFESAKLLACGEENWVEHIGKTVEGDDKPLTKNEDFKKAKWEGGSSALVFVSPQIVDKDVRKDFFEDVGPMTMAAQLGDAGFKAIGHFELRGKKIDPDTQLPKAGKLELAERLQSDTIAYLAFSTKSDLDGKEAEKQLVKALSKSDENLGEQVEKGLDGMKELVGFNLATLLDAIGDEAILGVAASDKLDAKMIVKKDMKALDELGLVIAVKVKEVEAAEKVVKGLREAAEQKGGMFADVSKTDDGFLLKPKDSSLPNVSVEVVKEKYLVIAAGKKSRVEEISAAFAGEGDTLKGDKAHKQAIAAVGAEQHLLLWVDVGRIAHTFLEGEEGKAMRKDLDKQNFSLDAFVLEGDNRFTAAVGARFKLKDDLLVVDVDTLNAPTLAVFGGLGAMMPRGRSGGDDFPDMPTPPTPQPQGPQGGGGIADLPSTDIPECDEYLRMASTCKNASMRESLRPNLKQMADAWKQGAGFPSARPQIVESCKKMIESQAPFCR